MYNTHHYMHDAHRCNDGYMMLYLPGPSGYMHENNGREKVLIDEWNCRPSNSLDVKILYDMSLLLPLIDSAMHLIL